MRAPKSFFEMSWNLPATENLLRNGAFETLQADGCQIAGSSLEFRL